MQNFLMKPMAFVALIALTACQTPVTHKLELPKDTVGLAVSDVVVTTTSHPGEDSSAAWVDVPMTNQAEQWFRSRFKPVKGIDKGTVVIQKASFKASKGEYPMKYEMILDVRFEVRDTTGTSKKVASSLVRHATTVSSNMSSSERKAAAQKLINETITHADKELVQGIRSFMPHMIIGSDDDLSL